VNIVSIVGARPNFVKLAPLCWELENYSQVNHTVIHTGQHYDSLMSESFFSTLMINKPKININVGSTTHGKQTGRIMIQLEPVLQEIQPNWVITLGDVNSTVAASLVAVKLGIKTCHVEAGLRSFDRTMPEEINRIVTDSISDLFFVSEKSGVVNLQNEGKSPEQIKMVGNIMIDVLAKMLPQASTMEEWLKFKLKENQYIVGTFHRPSNVDSQERLKLLVDVIGFIATDWPIILPLHPRTQANLEKYDLMQKLNDTSGIVIIPPLDYISFLSLITKAMAVVTDSGGIQEETTWLGVPCLTMRENTERPITITSGTNKLVAMDKNNILDCLHQIARGDWKQGVRPPLWDGRTAQRIIEILVGV
jgi:UDP-N-acetylglucosamine 2-epimerase (non-hydrolysing)